MDGLPRYGLMEHRAIQNQTTATHELARRTNWYVQSSIGVGPNSVCEVVNTTTPSSNKRPQSIVGNALCGVRRRWEIVHSAQRNATEGVPYRFRPPNFHHNRTVCAVTIRRRAASMAHFVPVLSVVVIPVDGGSVGGSAAALPARFFNRLGGCHSSN